MFTCYKSLYDMPAIQPHAVTTHTIKISTLLHKSTRTHEALITHVHKQTHMSITTGSIVNVRMPQANMFLLLFRLIKNPVGAVCSILLDCYENFNAHDRAISCARGT